MADQQAAEFCSDTEDLFGDYDRILEDSSPLAKLDAAEHKERQRDAQPSAHADFTGLQPTNTSCSHSLTDSVLDELAAAAEPFEDLPASQLHLQEQLNESVTS